MFKCLFIFPLLICGTLQWQTALIESLGKTSPHILIEPVTSRQYGLYAIKRELDPLNLTCSVIFKTGDVELKYNITWTPPRTAINSNRHIVTVQSDNSASLMITHLEQQDEGIYTCEAQPLTTNHALLKADVVVNIIHGRECGEAMFMCKLSKYSNCIHRRFTCDGYQDCEMGEDEDKDMCGFEPCTNKLPCQDHTAVIRCIPKAWCCNKRMDANCTVKEPLTCCPNLFQKFMDDRRYYDNLKPHYYDMAFAIYTAIGCAVVFMVVVTVLVIAICRIYTRTQWPNNLSPRSTHFNENAAAMYEVDMYCGEPPSLLLTYNIGQELQTLRPPPYSQVVPIPPKHGPPPPYTPLDVTEEEALINQSATQGIENGQHSGTVMRSE